MERELEELAREIVRAQKSETSEPPKAPVPAFTLNTLFERGPAWIALLVAAIVGYASLNTRVSTCEYQNQISITDRADLRRRLDKSDDTLSEMKTDLGEIKVTLKTARRPPQILMSDCSTHGTSICGRAVFILQRCRTAPLPPV